MHEGFWALEVENSFGRDRVSLGFSFFVIQGFRP